MEKKINKILLIIFIFLIININQINAKNNEQNILKENTQYNSILYVGGNGPGNYTTIQEAINNSNNEDKIYVYSQSSPYIENIIIDKSITLTGEDKNNTIIDGENKGTTITIKNNNIIIKEFTIKSNENIYFSSGIEILDSDNNEITNNIIINNYDGITINNSNNNNIYNNKIQNNGRTGILIKNSDQNIINENNISNNNNFGIFYSYSNDNKITNNKIIKNGWDGMVFRTSENNQIYSNNISGSFYYGVNLFSTDNINNIFYYNSFYNNGYNARGENNNKWDNGLKGNYWDDYEEKYPNASKKIRGIWNIPYKLGGQDNYDRYPLVKPYNPNIVENKLFFIGLIEEIILKILSIYK